MTRSTSLSRLSGLPRAAMLTASFAACGVLAALVWLVVWSLVPVVVGWHPTVVMSGSMEPRLHVGDVVISRPVAERDLHPGEVVLVHDPDHPGRLRLHRFAKVTDDGRLILRGDANAADDSSPVSPDEVLGVATLRIPDVGRPLVWLSTGRVVPLAGLVVGLGALVALGAYAGRGPTNGPNNGPTNGPSNGRGSGPRSGGGHGRGGSGRRRTHAARRPRATRALTRTATVAAVLAVALGIGSAAEAATRFSSDVTTPSAFTAATYFSCGAAATAGGAYLAYPFAEGSGSTVADVSGNGRSGTLHGSVARGSGGPCAADGGRSLTFTGSQYVAAPGLSTAPTTYSIETWFKTTTAGGALVGFDGLLSLSYDRLLYLTSEGRLVFGTYTGGLFSSNYQLLTTTRVTDGAWHHVVATQSGTGMRLYLDGRLVDSNSATDAQSIYGSWRFGSTPVSGWPSAPSSSYFVGSLGFTAIYTTALSADDVAAHDDAGRP